MGCPSPENFAALPRPPTCVSQIAFRFFTFVSLIWVNGEYRWFISEPPLVDHPFDGVARSLAVNAGAGTISALDDDDALCATPAAMATSAVVRTAAATPRRVRELTARFCFIILSLPLYRTDV